MKKQLSLVLLALSIVACSQVDDFHEPSTEPVQASEIFLHKGILSFPSRLSFKQCIDKIVNEENGVTRALSESSLPKFESIASLREKVTRTDLDVYIDPDEFELEIGDEADYKLSVYDDLVPDPALDQVLDTALRVIVSDSLYQITKYGTFISHIDYESALYETIAELDTTALINNCSTLRYQMNDYVLFIDSYGYARADDGIEPRIHDGDLIPDPDPFNPNPDPNPDPDPDEPVNEMLPPFDFSTTTREALAEESWGIRYNENRHRYNVERGFAENVFMIFSHNKYIERGHHFNKHRKVALRIFDVDYGFYQSAGVKGRMLKEKKMLWGAITYWRETKCDDLIIGFNNFYGVREFNWMEPIDKIFSDDPYGFKSYTSKLDGYYSKYLYNSYARVPFVKDFTDRIVKIIPSFLNDSGIYPQLHATNDLFDLPYDLIAGVLRKTIKDKVYKPMGKILADRHPAVAMYPKMSNGQYKKSKVYIVGEMHYGRRASKTIRFSQSFGITISNGEISPFRVESFKIKKIDAYAAAFYKGEYRASRIYN